MRLEDAHRLSVEWTHAVSIDNQAPGDLRQDAAHLNNLLIHQWLRALRISSIRMNVYGMGMLFS